MSSPYIGEIRIVSFGVLPRGWLYCSGQLLSIEQNQALFSLLGTMYGGDGVRTFGLPDLRGRSPIHIGPGFVQGQLSGEPTHTLLSAEMPIHNHTPVGSSAAATEGPSGALWAPHSSPDYGPPAGVGMNANSVANNGSNQPHQNMSPYLVLNFIIAVEGIFPSRN